MTSYTSVLDKDYMEPSRPYSQKELEFIRKKTTRTLRLGDIMAKHSKCNHYYYVRSNSRKETNIKESEDPDTGNCSVCWRLSKTSKYNKRKAEDLIKNYDHVYTNNKQYLTFFDVNTVSLYYKWLYFG